jgi:hypothetical protein
LADVEQAACDTLASVSSKIPKLISAYLAEIGKRGGEAGEGKSKRRSKRHYKEIGRAGGEAKALNARKAARRERDSK